jgi:hypothetical protein
MEFRSLVWAALAAAKVASRRENSDRFPVGRLQSSPESTVCDDCRDREEPGRLAARAIVSGREPEWFEDCIALSRCTNRTSGMPLTLLLAFY